MCVRHDSCQHVRPHLSLTSRLLPKLPLFTYPAALLHTSLRETRPYKDWINLSPAQLSLKDSFKSAFKVESFNVVYMIRRPPKD